MNAQDSTTSMYALGAATVDAMGEAGPLAAITSQPITINGIVPSSALVTVQHGQDTIAMETMPVVVPTTFGDSVGIGGLAQVDGEQYEVTEIYSMARPSDVQLHLSRASLPTMGVPTITAQQLTWPTFGGDGFDLVADATDTAYVDFAWHFSLPTERTTTNLPMLPRDLMRANPGYVTVTATVTTAGASPGETHVEQTFAYGEPVGQ